MDEKDRQEQLLKWRRMGSVIKGVLEEHLTKLPPTWILDVTLETVKALEALEASEAEEPEREEVKPKYGLYRYFALDTERERNDKHLKRRQRQLARAIDRDARPSVIKYYKACIRSWKQVLGAEDARVADEARAFSDLRDVGEKYVSALAEAFTDEAHEEARRKCFADRARRSRHKTTKAAQAERCRRCHFYTPEITYCRRKGKNLSYQRPCDLWEGDER